MRLSGVLADTPLSHVSKSCETSMECSFYTCQPLSRGNARNP